VHRGTIIAASRAAEEAVRASWHDYSLGRLADEEDLTAAFLTRLRDRLITLTSPAGYGFDCRTLTHRRGGEEKRVGADFGVKLEINTDDQRACYGWIAQAKLASAVRWVGDAAHPGLREQCAVMLDTTNASFAVLYAPESVVFGANDVASLVARDSHRVLTARGVEHHFHDFLSGAFGDREVCNRVFDAQVVRDRRARFGLEETATLVPVEAVLDVYFGRLRSDSHTAWTRTIGTG
jgi:hypothetical protein